MRNYITKTAAWCCMLLFLVGCAGTPPDFNGSFSCKLAVENGTSRFYGDFCREWMGCYTFTVTQPESFAGLTLQRRNGEITLSFEGMEVTQEAQWLPCSSFFGAVTESLDDIAGQENPSPDFQDQDVVVYSGTVTAGDYTIAYDGKTKNPADLNISGILATFTEVTPYGATE